MLKTLFSGKGRIGRRELLLLMLGTWIISFATGAIGKPVASVLSIPLMVISLAASVRRLHDFGWSGWGVFWQWVTGFVFGGSVAILSADPMLSFVVLAGLSGFAYLILFGMMFVRPGACGENEFGVPDSGSLKLS